MVRPSSTASGEPYTSSPQLAKPPAFEGTSTAFRVLVARSIAYAEIQKLIAFDDTTTEEVAQPQSFGRPPHRPNHRAQRRRS